MDSPTFFVIFLFVFATSTQRILVSGRLKGEVLVGYCKNEDTVTKRDLSFGKLIHRTFGKDVGTYNMECGGKLTVGPGVVVKEIASPLSDAGEPEHCALNLQAPQGYHVYLYFYSYQFIAKDECINNKYAAAGLASFYDGTPDNKTLLYRAAHHEPSFNVTSTGRDIEIDLNLSGKRWGLYAPMMKYQKMTFKYAFIRKEHGKYIVHGKSKP